MYMYVGICSGGWRGVCFYMLWEEQHPIFFPLLKGYVCLVNKSQLVLCTLPDQRDAFGPLHLSLYHSNSVAFNEL